MHNVISSEVKTIDTSFPLLSLLFSPYFRDDRQKKRFRNCSDCSFVNYVVCVVFEISVTYFWLEILTEY